MGNYPQTLKRKLLDIIYQMQEDLSKYTTDPKRDFTRNRKLPFETLCRTILSMSGQSLNVELQRQFHYDPTAVTTSAFVQQRGKLLPAVFEEILRRFTYKNRSMRSWNGYTLLAVEVLMCRFQAIFMTRQPTLTVPGTDEDTTCCI